MHPSCIYASPLKIKMPPLESQAEPLVLFFLKNYLIKSQGFDFSWEWVGGEEHAEYVNLLYEAYLILGKNNENKNCFNMFSVLCQYITQLLSGVAFAVRVVGFFAVFVVVLC